MEDSAGDHTHQRHRFLGGLLEKPAPRMPSVDGKKAYFSGDGSRYRRSAGTAGSEDKVSHRKEDIQVRERLPVMLEVVVAQPLERPLPL